MQEPTLLVFTLGASRESRRRRLLPAGQGAVEKRLHRACLDSALIAGREAGCRLEVSSPDLLDLPSDVTVRPQSGRGFGPRLAEAVRDASHFHGGPMVLVGSDTPGLSSRHVCRSLELLREDPERVVVGPSPDGGFYLLASAQPLDQVFSEVRWCCRQTLKSLCRALARQGRRVALLAPLVDLDGPSALESWLAKVPATLSLVWQGLVDALRRVLVLLRRTRWQILSLTPTRRSATGLPSLRAPPRWAPPLSA